MADMGIDIVSHARNCQYSKLMAVLISDRMPARPVNIVKVSILHSSIDELLENFREFREKSLHVLIALAAGKRTAPPAFRRFTNRQ